MSYGKSPDWFQEAACKGVGPVRAQEIFFPKTGGSREYSKYCSKCPVSDECGNYAKQIARDLGMEVYGVWGGANEKERRLKRGPRFQPRLCDSCLLSYTPNLNSQRYCSRACQKSAWRATPGNC